MFDRQQKIEMTAEELSVVEAALHTQAKILGVQAAAGGSGARRRLNEVKRVLAQVTQQLEPTSTATPSRRRRMGWFGFARASS